MFARRLRRFGMNLISAVSPRGDMRFQCIDGKMNSRKFIQFLKKLHGDAKQPILVITDNARYHHSKETQAFIEKQEEKKADAKPKISIQQRMKEQVADLCGTWEGYIDQLMDQEEGDFDLKSFNPYHEMRAYAGGVIKPNHAKIIKDDFAHQLAEAKEVKEWKDEEIKEAYAFTTPQMRKAYLAFYERIDSACDTMIQTG